MSMGNKNKGKREEKKQPKPKPKAAPGRKRDDFNPTAARIAGDTAGKS
jgi:hypothetical protein